MKKVLLSCIFLFIFLSANSQDLTDAANYARYARANDSIKDKKVVFIGNSITEGWARSNPGFFYSNDYVGRGISGQTSPQLLLRFQQDVINLKPEAVLINIGINDIAQNTGEYNEQFTFDCIISMSELARCNGIKVILSSILPADKIPWREEIENVVKKVDSLNAMIKDYADKNSFEFIDYNSIMRDETGALQKEFGRDAIHPSKEGYNVMEKIAKPIIDKALGL